MQTATCEHHEPRAFDHWECLQYLRWQEREGRRWIWNRTVASKPWQGMGLSMRKEVLMSTCLESKPGSYTVASQNNPQRRSKGRLYGVNDPESVLNLTNQAKVRSVEMIQCMLRVQQGSMANMRIRENCESPRCITVVNRIQKRWVEIYDARIPCGEMSWLWTVDTSHTWDEEEYCLRKGVGRFAWPPVDMNGSNTITLWEDCIMMLLVASARRSVICY